MGDVSKMRWIIRPEVSGVTRYPPSVAVPTESARFSMLLSIPVIVGAGALEGWDLYRAGNAQLTADALIAAGLAFVAALVAIAAMMAWLRRASFAPFVVYRIALGGFLLAVVYGWAG